VKILPFQEFNLAGGDQIGKAVRALFYLTGNTDTYYLAACIYSIA
jgi:hypothetical protein